MSHTRASLLDHTSAQASMARKEAIKNNVIQGVAARGNITRGKRGREREKIRGMSAHESSRLESRTCSRVIANYVLHATANNIHPRFTLQREREREGGGLSLVRSLSLAAFSLFHPLLHSFLSVLFFSYPVALHLSSFLSFAASRYRGLCIFSVATRSAKLRAKQVAQRARFEICTTYVQAAF